MGHVVYSINSVRDLHNVVIPHFKKYPLLTIKSSTFTLFKDIIELLINKEHLDSNGLLKIMCIRIQMNRGITEEGLEMIKLIKSRMNSKRI
jgi:hypothetical protein